MILYFGNIIDKKSFLTKICNKVVIPQFTKQILQSNGFTYNINNNIHTSQNLSLANLKLMSSHIIVIVLKSEKKEED